MFVQGWIYCQTLQMSVCQDTYLGHGVGNGIVFTKRLQAVEAFPRPGQRNKYELSQASLVYYRRFIPDYSSIAVPLTDLTRRNAPTELIWRKPCNRAFNQLKNILCSTPVLRSPHFDRDSKLMHSTMELVWCLTNEMAKGLDHPNAYFSKKTEKKIFGFGVKSSDCVEVRLFQRLQPVTLRRHLEKTP